MAAEINNGTPLQQILACIASGEAPSAALVDALADDNEDEAYALLLRQQSFLEDHLLSWFPMMESDMKKFAKTDFYRGLADLTRGFLETDLELINELVSEDSE